MQFDKPTLIKAIEDALKVDADSRKSAEIEEKKLRDESAQKWITEQRPKLVAYRDAMTKALKKDFVTHKDLPGRNDSLPLFDPDPYDLRTSVTAVYRDRKRSFVNRSEFSALRSALMAMEGNTVTDRQLGAMGFGASSVSKVFRGAVTQEQAYDAGR